MASARLPWAGDNGFFVQAEDGIRDRDVTGVQTCALPILAPAPTRPRSANGASEARITAAAPEGPKTVAPRARPVPLSMFRYAESKPYSGFGSSNVPKC